MMHKLEKKKNILYVVYSIFFGFFNVYTYMYTKGFLENSDSYLILIWNVILVSFLVYYGIKKIRISKMTDRILNIEKDDVRARKYFGCVFLVLFIAWFLIFLAYYPGLFAYDVAGQIPQTWGNFRTHHPLLHTIYLKFFYWLGGNILGSYNRGIALATLLQMLIFAGSISFVHLYLYGIGVKKYFRYLLILWTALSPVFSMMSISLTKDIFFTACFAIVFTYLCCYNSEFDVFKRKQNIIFYVVSIVGTIGFRNNGKYSIYILVIVLLLQSIRKKRVEKIFLYTVFGLIAGILLLFSLKQILSAKDGSKNEMLSIPYQQLACAYHENRDIMSEDEKQAILYILPDVEMYNPHKSDEIKSTAKGNADLRNLIKVYISIGLKYPASYFNGIIALDAGYLSVADISFSEIYGTSHRQGIFLSDTKQGFGIEHIPMLPRLEKLYEKLYTENDYQKVLGLKISCSPAFYFWILIYVMLEGFLGGAIGKLLPMQLYLMVFLMTILAGPCVLVRYALPYILCLPVMGGYVIHQLKGESRIIF